MKLLMTSLLFIILSVSYAFVTSNVIKQVEEKYGRFAKNRFMALERLMASLEGKTDLEKLEKVNEFFNNVPYSRDIQTYGVTDYWATPFEFLARDKGDCEDYVIAKYFVLKQLGIESSKMYLTYVRVENYDDAHMVLTYFPSPRTQPYVLDNIRRIVLPASKRTDLTPVFNFNPEVLQDGKKTTAHRKWDTLLKHIKENKI
ncbi:MAG: transglutaminase-like cysteine peptidase [Arcobacteraceae bacterium]|jgi:predicted transglutaminase-like cysteine proteinase